MHFRSSMNADGHMVRQGPALSTLCLNVQVFLRVFSAIDLFCFTKYVKSSGQTASRAR